MKAKESIRYFCNILKSFKLIQKFLQMVRFLPNVSANILTKISFCQFNAGDISLRLTELFNNYCQTLGKAFILIEGNSSKANGLIVQYHEVLM